MLIIVSNPSLNTDDRDNGNQLLLDRLMMLRNDRNRTRRDGTRRKSIRMNNGRRTRGNMQPRTIRQRRIGRSNSASDKRRTKSTLRTIRRPLKDNNNRTDSSILTGNRTRRSKSNTKRTPEGHTRRTTRLSLTPILLLDANVNRILRHNITRTTRGITLGRRRTRKRNSNGASLNQTNHSNRNNTSRNAERMIESQQTAVNTGTRSRRLGHATSRRTHNRVARSNTYRRTDSGQLQRMRIQSRRLPNSGHHMRDGDCSLQGTRSGSPSLLFLKVP